MDKLFITKQINKICANVLETFVEEAPDLEKFDNDTRYMYTLFDYDLERQQKLKTKSTIFYQMFMYLLSAPELIKNKQTGDRYIGLPNEK